MWNYLYFMVYLSHKPDDEYTGQESYVSAKLQLQDVSFFPLNKSMDLQALPDGEGVAPTAPAPEAAAPPPSAPESPAVPQIVIRRGTAEEPAFLDHPGSELQDVAGDIFAKVKRLDYCLEAMGGEVSARFDRIESGVAGAAQQEDVQAVAGQMAQLSDLLVATGQRMSTIEASVGRLEEMMAQAVQVMRGPRAGDGRQQTAVEGPGPDRPWTAVEEAEPDRFTRMPTIAWGCESVTSDPSGSKWTAGTSGADAGVGAGGHGADAFVTDGTPEGCGPEHVTDGAAVGAALTAPRVNGVPHPDGPGDRPAANGFARSAGDESSESDGPGSVAVRNGGTLDSGHGGAVAADAPVDSPPSSPAAAARAARVPEPRAPAPATASASPSRGSSSGPRTCPTVVPVVPRLPLGKVHLPAPPEPRSGRPPTHTGATPRSGRAFTPRQELARPPLSARTSPGPIFVTIDGSAAPHPSPEAAARPVDRAQSSPTGPRCGAGGASPVAGAEGRDGRAAWLSGSPGLVSAKPQQPESSRIRYRESPVSAPVRSQIASPQWSSAPASPQRWRLSGTVQRSPHSGASQRTSLGAAWERRGGRSGGMRAVLPWKLAESM